ncbi:SIR2 family protein [Candidatus Nitrosotenuis sp. DW1]|uniref:SIR2 family protein n=1 Tax=Candidatus Nitrosotenuis sp. DW1 TaxID=2259672 RepID=UPI0015CCEF11|nr:SIR2 family protein [Candidatus Nitrosotenuis sp. DW1]QLH08923.1 hypothetical protein DSQ19_04990 [Candidatus Nitrosotenuis sp. DW1]
MKIALFLGAGASVPYHKPTTTQLKELLSEKYGGNPYAHLLDHNQLPDIEYVLSAIKQTLEYSTTHGGEFLKTYDQTFFNLITGLKNVKEHFENEVFDNYSWNNDDDNTVNAILNPIFKMISDNSQEVIVFTTNYDRAIEEFCSNDDNHYRCIDGFKLHEDSDRFLWNDGDYSYADSIQNKTKVFLYKIHGSLNWKKHRKYGIEKTTYERKPQDPNYEEDFLIYPTLSPKEEANGREPYNTILKKFDEIMKSIDVCIVIGFSFRDEHINEKFKEFVDRGGTLIAISPSSQYDFRTRILNHTPTEEEKQAWENLPYARLTGTGGKDSVNWNIQFVQKRLEIGTIKEILHDITRTLQPKEHLF